MSENMMRMSDTVIFRDGQFGKSRLPVNEVRTMKLFHWRDVRQQLRNSFLTDAQNA
jgi:hypothetical protein